MRITNIILDAIIHSSLFEMAEHRKDILLKIDSKAWLIDSHLLKILMYENVIDYDHWCSEITGWLKSVQRLKLKGSKKRLDRRDYFKLLWESLLESVDEVQSHMEEVARDYPNYKIVNYDPAIIHKRLYDILSNVCYDIEHGIFTDIRSYL
jgi:hypothetical protein